MDWTVSNHFFRFFPHSFRLYDTADLTEDRNEIEEFSMIDFRAALLADIASSFFVPTPWWGGCRFNLRIMNPEVQPTRVFRR